ncbi:MAG: hypothetical protein ACXVHB_00920 [Solirubrobacteraceae bacterium]
MKGNTGDNTVFDEDFDDAPTVLVKGQPGPNAANVRTLEREMSGLSEWDPITNGPAPITDNIADQQEEQILHMQNADPLRLPTFTLFGNADFFFQDRCVAGANPDPGCWKQNPGFAWNHGDDQPEIASTWQGWVGPGVQNLGVDATLWTDHPDARPTLLSLLGLSDDYTEDGRAIAQIMTPAATPAPIAADPTDYDALSSAYKQLDAPFGEFGRDSLMVSTKAVSTSSPSDSVYQAWDAQLAACQALRTPLVSQMDNLMHNATFNGAAIDAITAQSLTEQANELITDMRQLNADATPPNYDLCGGTPPNPTVLGVPRGRRVRKARRVRGDRVARPARRRRSPAPTAKIHHGQLVSITCKESGVSHGARAVVALSRAHRIVGWGEGRVRSRITLHHRARLHGRYLLTVTVVGGGPRSKTHVRL